MNLYFAFRQTEGIESPLFDHLWLKSPLELEEKLCLFVCFGACFLPLLFQNTRDTQLKRRKGLFWLSGPLPCFRYLIGQGASWQGASRWRENCSARLGGQQAPGNHRSASPEPEWPAGGQQAPGIHRSASPEPGLQSMDLCGC